MFMQKLESRKQIFSNKNITIIYKTLNCVASKPPFQAKICELILMHVFFLFILSILLIHWSRSITISMFVHIAVTIHTSININNPHKQTFTVYLHLPNSEQRLIKKIQRISSKIWFEKKRFDNIYHRWSQNVTIINNK